MAVVTRKEGKNKKKQTTAAAITKKGIADTELSTKSPSETLDPTLEEDKEDKEEADAIADPSSEVEPARAK